VSAINPRVTPFIDHRRSRRILLAISVQVSGVSESGKAFMEETKTETLNFHGGMILLKVAVSERQPLTMKNLMTGEEIR